MWVSITKGKENVDGALTQRHVKLISSKIVEPNYVVGKLYGLSFLVQINLMKWQWIFDFSFLESVGRKTREMSVVVCV